MLGLSITAIGLRTTSQCMEIFQTLQQPMQLDFLELAIGSLCDINFDYPNVPIILHDSCLYKDGIRKRLSLQNPQTWRPYAEFIKNHNVHALSLHAPLQRDITKHELEVALSKLEDTLGVPVYVEVMPTEEYWCSSLDTLVNHPLLLDVSHILIWRQGNLDVTKETCLRLLNSVQVGEIHLSHNKGKADTHDLIPADVWFAKCIQEWGTNYFVTFESLPKQYAEYERLDKCKFHKNKKPTQTSN